MDLVPRTAGNLEDINDRNCWHSPANCLEIYLYGVRLRQPLAAYRHFAGYIYKRNEDSFGTFSAVGK